VHVALRRAFLLVIAASAVAGCGGGDGSSTSTEVTVDSVTSCLKDAGAAGTATQPNPEPYGGDAVAAKFPGQGKVGVLIFNDAETAKAVGGLYSLKNPGESAYVTDDGQNVIVTPEDPDSSTLTTLRSCTK
jgi:hypothetical protein